MEKRSGEFALFKGKGAFKAKVILPKYSEKGFVAKDGAIILDIAPTDGKSDLGLPNVDWSKKVTFALGVPDITILLDAEAPKMIHKIGDVTKTLVFKPGVEKYEGTYMCNITDGTNSVSVPFSGGEFNLFKRLCLDQVSRLIGWDQVGTSLES